jgi:preprotein translocase subunit SecG
MTTHFLLAPSLGRIELYLYPLWPTTGPVTGLLYLYVWVIFLYILTLMNHTEGEQLEDRRNVGESSCNSGDGTDQRVHYLMFMMMMMMIMNLLFVVRYFVICLNLLFRNYFFAYHLLSSVCLSEHKKNKMMSLEITKAHR